MSDEDVAGRLAALEKHNRFLAGSLLALSALTGLAAFRSPREPDGQALRARSFELVDAAGRVRAELAIDADGSAGLFVRDEEAHVRAAVIHDDAQSALYLWDAAGRIRVGAAQYAHGGGGFALHDEEARASAVLYLKGEGSLTFHDGEGELVERLPR